ncbi:MAG: 4'-phosphopantetheinyl transferase superfamily protein [Chlamydiae bacterium]|nr:4'-phosphopantetheinyl transferase superfamily protein [Chlamydiota bacterium]
MTSIQKNILLISDLHFLGQPISIGEQDVHLWLLHRDMLLSKKTEYLQKLDANELKQLGMFQKEKNKEDFILRHGILHELLSAYVGPILSRNLKLNPMNKPFLDKEKISFNISSSNDFILIGFVKEANIGVDIEIIHPPLMFDHIISECFSENEKYSIAKEQDPMRLFFQYWNAKEAILKALGTGILFPLSQLDCSALKNENTWTYINAPFMSYGAWVQSFLKKNLSFVVAIRP